MSDANINGDRIVNVNDESAIASILATIRQTESGNNYSAQAKGASASGAYQFIDSSWKTLALATPGAQAYANGHAKDAPPSVQDSVARKFVVDILNQSGGHLAAVPVHWYWPKAWGNASELDTIPMASSGNTLTVRQYAEKWIRNWGKQSGTIIPVSSTSDTTSAVPDSSGNTVGGLKGLLYGAASAVPGGGLVSSFLDVPFGLIDAAGSVVDILKTVLSPAFMIKVLKIVGGAILIGLGVIFLAKDQIEEVAPKVADVAALAAV